MLTMVTEEGKEEWSDIRLFGGLACAIRAHKKQCTAHMHAKIKTKMTININFLFSAHTHTDTETLTTHSTQNTAQTENFSVILFSVVFVALSHSFIPFPTLFTSWLNYFRACAGVCHTSELPTHI